ncbi:MAG: S8 family serine peptidase, partial [Chloroflexota bacterium]|nr:S8 family serine peptidase [Chloroflexota bacterium]
MKQKTWIIAIAVIMVIAMITPSLAEPPEPAALEVGAAPEIMKPQTDGDAPTTVPAKRWIVQLEDAPLAQYTGGVAGMRATAASATGAARLDVNSPDAKAYVSYLKTQQTQVAAAVQKAVPGAYVEHDYQVAFNGLTVNLPEADENADFWLSQLPGVKQVFREKVYHLDMYASLPLIDAPTLWGMVGGQASAGEGIKIASIDSGIYPFNDCFDPTGYTYPPGYPLFDTDKPYTTTAKVIVARAYFRADDPPTTGDEATWPGTSGSSHGTHTSGSMACLPDIVAETNGYTETISGVAPAAYLMSYKVFYPTSSEYSGSAFDPELIAAVEDAVADGADVVNNSWGEGSGSTYPDALDLAYDAAWDAGVVVVFSAGNSGPYPSTVDHESSKNILVGASTTSGTIAAGRLSVSAPEPLTDTLQNLAYTTALFGEELASGQVYTYPFVSAQVISPTNFEGCGPWPAGTFTGKAALISRGTCDFSLKVYNAQEGGADFVIVHNHAAGGDTLINMSPGTNAVSVTIPSVFIMHTPGLAMVDWYTTYTDTSEITFDTLGYQLGNIPDRMAAFSSRGPSLRHMIQPDVVAPGVNIFASGYGGGSGVARHEGFGAVSGTSMAAPHVSGAAAVLKQLHPDWTPDQIKSALMSTAVLDVADYDGSEAGVLDYGAGRIDLGHAGDPGLTFDMPSVSFGKMYAGDSDSATIVATDVFSRTAAPFTYTLTISETGDMTTTAYFTLSVTPSSLTFDDDGDTASFDVTMEIAANAPAGDYDGLVWLRHGSHELHIPVWARVWPVMQEGRVLLIDNDSSWLLGLPDYRGYYTRTLEALGVAYDIYNPGFNYGNDLMFPDLATLQQYEAAIWFTGDNYYPDGNFPVSTPPSEGDLNILVAYLQGGGRLLATGQDLASASGALESGVVLYDYFLGADYVQDDVFSG